MERKPLISKMESVQIGASVALGNAIWMAADLGLSVNYSPENSTIVAMYQEGGINSRLIMAAVAALAFHVIQESTKPKT